MIVRHLKDLLGTHRDIQTKNWDSRRLLLEKDGMGFSMHDTLIKAGSETRMCYRHHLEAVYCVTGSGEIEDLESGEIYSIEAGTMYALNQHESHILRGFTDMRMVCVFNPPVKGTEVHDETGAYPIEVST
ncbi:MAG: ectoine synthase [Acidobacteria bacterium]|nr:ectoine synthase [Acidobacteriota bacterium]